MSHVTGPNPYDTPNWSSDYFREPVPAGVSPLGRGLVGHVPLIAIALIVQGGLEMVFALMVGFVALMIWLVPEPAFQNMQGMSLILFLLAVPAVVCGPLRIIAGVFNLRYRRRVLGMTALGLGLLTMITAYCAPTSIALAVYGLIVYLNDSVIAAFALGDAGKNRSDINAAFPPNA